MSAAIVWFRQDLRLKDNPALYNAAINHPHIIPIYILDESSTWSIGSAQQWWLHHSLVSLQEQFEKAGLTLILRKGDPAKILMEICKKEKVAAVYCNRCYEPENIQRDAQIKKSLSAHNVVVQSYNGSLLIEPWELANKQGSYFKVFTPFWNRLQTLTLNEKILPVPELNQKIILKSDSLVSWELLPVKPDWAAGFKNFWRPGEQHAAKQLNHFLDKCLLKYAEGRDYPAEQLTSRLSPYLHFGEISPKQINHKIKSVMINRPEVSRMGQHFLRQIAWREFSYHLLYHFPALPEENFQKKYNQFSWVSDKTRLLSWQKGLTGYPIVDAGMRELWHTGYMHNRVRMITASFLIKHLLIDWRVGERWFWETLLDADLANNAMNWQWVAGSGVDASPYYRIFNPILQGEKFDAEGLYVRQWVPELAKLPDEYIHQPWEAPDKILQNANVLLGGNYPKPIVDHNMARQRALAQYKKIKNDSPKDQ